MIRSMASRGRTFLLAPLLVLPCLVGGCAEFVAEGHISDRETSAPVPDVEVLQSTRGDAWRQLGRTDGRGAYWVMKSKVIAGSRIRFKKPGYYPLDMLDNEFITGSSFLITPTGRGPEGNDAAEPADESDPFGSP